LTPRRRPREAAARPTARNSRRCSLLPRGADVAADASGHAGPSAGSGAAAAAAPSASGDATSSRLRFLPLASIRG
jgi:hypothetical protein